MSRITRRKAKVSGALDNVIHAANIIRNKLDGVTKAISPIQVKAKMDAGEDFLAGRARPV